MSSAEKVVTYSWWFSSIPWFFDQFLDQSKVFFQSNNICLTAICTTGIYVLIPSKKVQFPLFFVIGIIIILTQYYCEIWDLVIVQWNVVNGMICFNFDLISEVWNRELIAFCRSVNKVRFVSVADQCNAK